MSFNIDVLSPALIESTLSTVFDLFKQKVIATPEDRANFDFILKDDEGRKTAIEVMRHNIRTSFLYSIKDILLKSSDISKFVLVTPENPDERRIAFFRNLFNDLSIKCEWHGIKEFLVENYNIEINNSIDLMNVQTAAITSKYNSYNKESIGNNILNTGKKQKKTSSTDVNNTVDNNEDARAKLIQSISSQDENYKHNYLLTSLRRQFPDSLLSKLTIDEDKIVSELFIGRKYDDAIIVLTDIKNFSRIVAAAEPDDLNEAMSKYYTNARDLVFKYDGILDKFIGDAVLAVFNFPKKNSSSYINVVKFCSELILMGNEILANLFTKMDQTIATGTRIGIANGPIYTLNIGGSNMEVTFIGDKINFAARLEKKCIPNGILLSNRFYNKLHGQYNELVGQLEIQQIEIDPEDAKGQAETTKAWQLKESNLKNIIDFVIPSIGISAEEGI